MAILEHMPVVPRGLMQRMVDMHQQHLLLHDTQIHTMRADEQVVHELQAVQVGQQTHVLLMAGCIH